MHFKSIVITYEKFFRDFLLSKKDKDKDKGKKIKVFKNAQNGFLCI